MSNYRAGDIIRMTREFVGMSREELSDEICSVQTLYRIESGKTRVKRELYARLMAKMERVPEKFCPLTRECTQKCRHISN